MTPEEYGITNCARYYPSAPKNRIGSYLMLAACVACKCYLVWSLFQ